MVLGSKFWVLGSAICVLFLPFALMKAAPQPAAAKVVFDGGRAYEHLRQVVSFGPRPAGSPALEKTREYIIGQLKTLGVGWRSSRSTRTLPSAKFTW